MENNKPEARRSIGDFSAYEVTTRGRIWSSLTESFLNPTVTEHGYYLCRLRDDSGKWRTRLVHRLVLLAFRGEPSKEKPNCLHFDGNKLNNNLENLRWGSQKDNMADMLRHIGRYAQSTLSDEQVRLIRASCKGKRDGTRIAKLFNLDATRVNCILRRATYAYVS